MALGRAIVRQPQVFLFDEPLSNLDAKLRVQMRAEIAALHHRLGTTMIYVTHDQVEAMTLGERIVIMDGGVVQQADAPLTLYREPANRFVAGVHRQSVDELSRGRRRRRGALHSHGRVAGTSAPKLAGLAVLGFRAEDLLFDGAGPSLGRATLEVVEQMGHESLGYFQLAGDALLAPTARRQRPRPGDAIEPRLRPAGWRLFADDAAGRRLE